MATCRSCGTEIIWAETTGGKATPLDAKPDERGRWVIVNGKVTLVTEEDRRLLRTTHHNHFLSCRDRDKWRRSADEKKGK